MVATPNSTLPKTAIGINRQKIPFRETADQGFRAALAKSVNELPERERLVMSLYYNDELNLREIGEVLKVTESRVCQLHGQALTRLKARLTEWRDIELED